MILSFKPQFVDKILDGTKIHTIRKDKSGRWFPGRPIHFAIGVRTKEYNRFAVGFCEGVQTIKIHYGNIPKHSPDIYINDVLMTIEDANEMSYNDGFESFYDFKAWFYKDFEGVIIHWTDFKY